MAKRHLSAVAMAAAFTLSTSAHADSWFAFEAGIGVSHYATGSDGEWYQQGMTHSLRTNTPAWRLGIQVNAIDHQPGSYVPGLAFHLAYLNLGYLGLSSPAAPDKDPYYTANGGYYDPQQQRCVGNCKDVRYFNSGGRMQVIALTAEPFWTKGAWRFGVEAGPALFHVQWNATATNPLPTTFWGPAGRTETFTADPHWEVGAIAGLSVGRGPFSVRYDYVWAKQHNFSGTGGYVPAGWRGAHVVTLNYTF